MSDHISKTVEFVKERLAKAEAGHNWFHIARVWQNAQLILQEESANEEVVTYASLLHDIADSKFHNGDEELGPQIAGNFLRGLSVSETVILHVQEIIRHMSFKVSLGQVTFRSKEMDIVQDADRLDAIGAIGIARAFHYGGFKNREIYNPIIPANPAQDKETYKNTTAPTINHFYEKLLLLKDQMNTQVARRIAASRHEFMEKFLEEFHAEWVGKR